MPSIDLETYWCLGKAIRRVLEFEDYWSDVPAIDTLENAREHVRLTAVQKDIEECPMCKEEGNK